MENLSPHFKRKLRQVKLVATDLDGTLLNDHGQISGVTRESVQRLKGLGMQLAIMTGRAHSSAERIADDLGMETPIISMDGGLVRRPHGTENIFCSCISPRIVLKILDEADAKFLSVALFTDDRMVRRESEVILPGYIESLELDTVETDDLRLFAERTIRIIVGTSSRNDAKALARRVGGIFSTVGTSIYRSSREIGTWYLEVKNKNQSKATGLSHLEKYLRIGKNEVAVVGDFQNDIMAFDRAGVGIAMKNAVAELKEKADWVTSRTNDDDGAAEFFELVYKMRTNHVQ